MQSFRIGPLRLAPHKRSGRLTGQWLVDIPATLAGGRRKRKFFDNRKYAERFARELERCYRRGELSKPADPEPKPTTLRSLVEDWSAFQRLRVETGKKRPRTLECDDYRLRILLVTFGSSLVRDISEERILAYQAKRLRSGRSPSTINSDLRVLMKVLRWALRKQVIDVLPEYEWLPEHNADTVVPTQDEVRRIIGHLPKRLRLLVRPIATTGCRSGEAFNLTWDRVNLEERWVEFSPHGD